MTIIYAIIMFTILIFVHELGHFVAAKACGVKVNDFAIGMGPSLLKKTKGETTYHIKAFPIGGFCAMEGEDAESEDPKAFNNKKPWQKIIIVCAGAFMNLVTAILIITIVIAMSGFPTTTIDKVDTKGPAYKAGIRSGDELVAVNGAKVESWEDFSKLIRKYGHKDSTINIKIKRNGREEVFTSKLEKAPDGRLIVGVISKLKVDIGRSVIEGPKATWHMTKNMYTVLRQLFTGKVATKELSGPVGIVYFVDQSIKKGVINFLMLMAIISLNLAVFNMLPLPALDGGRLIFIIIRKFTGGVITDRMEGIVHAVGMILLLSLALYVTWNDIIKFILPAFK